MGMQFTVRLNGRVEAECEAEDLGLDLDNANDWLDVKSSVELSDASVSGTVTLSAYATVEDEEVEAADLADYDADAALQEHVSPYGIGTSVTDADFEITRSPTGFEAVEAAIDRDSAIAAYAALAGAGYEVV